MNFFNLSAPYINARSDDSDFNYDMIDFQFTTGSQNCECIASGSVYTHLCSAKQTIETCDPDDWDDMKKVTNPYEYIHTSVPGYKYPVSRFKPLSRSFYKMIEIVKQCKLLPSAFIYRLPPQMQPSDHYSGGTRNNDYSNSNSNKNGREYKHRDYHRSSSSYYTYAPSSTGSTGSTYGGGGGGTYRNHRGTYHRNGISPSGNLYYNKNYHSRYQSNGFYKHHPINTNDTNDTNMSDANDTNDTNTRDTIDTIDTIHTVNANGTTSNNEPVAAVNAVNVNTDIDDHEHTSIRSFHLAEGPGGFIEALCYLRANPNDTYYGMTLVDETPNSACPGWKKSKFFLEKNPYVKLEYGKDGTGNLLSLENYLHCCNKYKHTMDFITADGGFDFSSDFNHQELLAQTLVVSEVLYALSLQKTGGTFVLKIFDTFTRVTIDIIHLLSSFYSDVIIIKPNTSRIANSEKYVVCKGFKEPASVSSRNKMIDVFSVFFKKLHELSQVSTYGQVSIDAILSSTAFHKLHIIHRIEEVNAILGQQQIENIISTVSLVHSKLADRVDYYKKAHIQKCIEWCERYNIPYNKHSMPSNTFMSSQYENGSGR